MGGSGYKKEKMWWKPNFIPKFLHNPIPCHSLFLSSFLPLSLSIPPLLIYSIHFFPLLSVHSFRPSSILTSCHFSIHPLAFLSFILILWTSLCPSLSYHSHYPCGWRVAVQNERYEDWSPILTRLRRLFNSYLPTVLDHHRQPNIYVPEATNSPASQGNFLEVLNISLNGKERFLPIEFSFVLKYSLSCS